MSLESPSRAEKVGNEIKLLTSRMRPLYKEIYTQNGKEQHFYVFIASSRRLVLSDSLTIDAIRSRILHGGK